jgi:hypothetical protein
MIGLGQKGTEKGWAALQSPQRHPQETRRSVGSYLQQQTEIRNGVTLCRAPHGAGVNRMRHSGGIPQDAKAAGKARG